MGIDEMGVDKVGVDEMGSRQSGMTPQWLAKALKYLTHKPDRMGRKHHIRDV